LCALGTAGGCASDPATVGAQPTTVGAQPTAVGTQPGAVGTRPAAMAAQVQIYLQPPPGKYRHIADLSATSRGSFKFSAAAKMDVVIERLKEQAARLGANGLLLHGVGIQSAGSVGAGVSTETNNPHAGEGLGFGASAFLSRKVGDGEAIFVEPLEPEATAPAN